MIRQRTVKTTIKATGVGLHTGVPSTAQIRPAPENTGIVFCRTDLSTATPKTPVYIRARPEHVGDTMMCTCLIKDEVRIGTVEHFMSAMAGLDRKSVV